jgi:hypothetical protein
MASADAAPRPMNRSGHRPRNIADRIPAGSPINRDSTMAPPASDSVAGMRCTIASVTFCDENSDVPRSPCSALPTQRAYCSITGSSSPNRVLVSSICSSVAFSPASVTAGSPGTSSTRENTISDTRKSTGIMMRIRRMISCSMWSASRWR